MALLINACIYITDKKHGNTFTVFLFCKILYIKWSFCNTQNYRSYKNHNIGDGPLFLEGWGGVGWVLAIFWGMKCFLTFRLCMFFQWAKACVRIILKSQTQDLESRKCVLYFFHCVFPCTIFAALAVQEFLGENCSNPPGPYLIKIIVFPL